MKRRSKKMRGKEKLLFLIMALSSFSIHLSANPLVDPKEEKAIVEDLMNRKYDQGSGTAIGDQNKIGRGAVGGGGNGGQPAVSGGSGTPNVQGGGGVTPVYAAGAANNHHYHHGGGSCNRSKTGLETLVMTTITCFLLCINKYW